MTMTAFDTANNNLLVGISTLIDTALLAGLYIVIRGYENFVVELGIDDHEDRFVYIGKVGFSGLKIKLISTVIAISALVLLKVFIGPKTLTNTELAWKVCIHLTFVISVLLSFITDYINLNTQNH